MTDRKIEMLYHFIDDTQNTIRFLDTKAAAILVFTGVIITIVLNNVSNLTLHLPTIPFSLAKTILIFIIASILLFFIRTAFFSFKVIQSNTVFSGGCKINGYQTQDLGFLSKIDMQNTTNEIYMNLKSLNSELKIVKELTFDYIKVSYIREVKMRNLDHSMKNFKIFLLFSFSFLFASLFLEILIGR